MFCEKSIVSIPVFAHAHASQHWIHPCQRKIHRIFVNVAGFN
jgi:hypothetical protein